MRSSFAKIIAQLLSAPALKCIKYSNKILKNRNYSYLVLVWGFISCLPTHRQLHRWHLVHIKAVFKRRTCRARTLISSFLSFAHHRLTSSSRDTFVPEVIPRYRYIYGFVYGRTIDWICVYMLPFLRRGEAMAVSNPYSSYAPFDGARWFSEESPISVRVLNNRYRSKWSPGFQTRATMEGRFVLRH